MAESKATDSKGKDLVILPPDQTSFISSEGKVMVIEDSKPIMNVYLNGANSNSSQSSDSNTINPSFIVYDASASSFPAVENDFDNPSDQGAESVFSGTETENQNSSNTPGDGLDGTADGEGMEGFATSDNQQTQIGLLQQIANGLKDNGEGEEPEPNNATGGQDCTQAPVCTLGESVECAQLMQLWLQRCESVNPDLSAKVDDYYQHGLGIEGNENGIVQSLDFGTAVGDILNTEITNACPADRSFSLLNQPLTLSSQPFCDAAQAIRPIVLAVGIFLVGLIVARGSY